MTVNCRLLLIVIVAIGLTFGAGGQLPAQAAKRLALVGGMLITGYEVPPIHHAAVVVEGNKIVAAGPASAIRIPAGATLVDTSGRTMISTAKRCGARSRCTSTWA